MNFHEEYLFQLNFLKQNELLLVSKNKDKEKNRERNEEMEIT